MKLLVTGAAGFIGSRLCRALLERGDRVVGLDNFDPYYDPALKERNLADLKGEGFSLVRADIRDAAPLQDLLAREEFDALAHFAALAAVRYSAQFPLLYAQVNVEGTANLLDAARLTNRPRCVLASSGSVYGASTPLPFREEAPASEPLAPYPASKRAMELFAHAFAHLYDLPTTVVRCFNVYGPHGRPDMMPWKWAQAIARGEPITLFDEGRLRRDWTFVDDIVRGTLAALDRPFAWEIINLGGGAPVENRRFVELLEELLGKRAQVVSAPSPPSEPPATFADLSKARQLLGYAPQVRVEEGLERFVAWMRREGHLG